MIKGGDSMDENMQGNNWVIYGNHTATGKPMLASNPHLGTSLPSFNIIIILDKNARLKRGVVWS